MKLFSSYGFDRSGYRSAGSKFESFETLEPRLLFTAVPLITEFLASNDTGLQDEDGDSSDWVELYNAGDTALDLNGWHLTDDAGDLSQWAFPAVSLDPGAFLVVFASNKDRAEADGTQLHTNFKLGSGGEYLALVEADGTTIAHEYSPEYLPQATDISFGIDVDDLPAGPQYYTTPTPGAENDDTGAFLGVVADTKFSIDRGVYTSPISVTITTDTPGATIYYTLDGSDPMPGIGTTQVYVDGSPIAISTTTTLRAMAARPGYESTDIDSQTYIFPADVLAQGTSPAGYPATWGGANGQAQVNADYEIDSDILGMHTQQELVAAFTEIPTLALTLPVDDLFDPNTGIYSNPTRGGAAWERGTAVEFFEADGSDGFGINAGIRVHGGFSRVNWSSYKLSFRLVFTEEYGPTKLEYPLFSPTSDIDSINTLILDGYWQNSLQHNNEPFALNAQYVRDILASDLQASTGSYAVNHRYSHLYINGQYWGLYVLHERPDDAALSEHLGGEREDYDVIHNNVNDVIAGTNDDLEALFNLANGNTASSSVYAQIQQLLDVEQFADYAVLSTWGSARDWQVNWYAARNSAADTPFQFYTWDTELILSDLGENSFGGSGSNPGGLLEDLRDNTEFRLTFADAAHRMLFNNGILSPDRAGEFLENRLTQIEDAVVLEYARWGDLRRPTNPYTVADWEAERNQLLTEFFLDRHAIYLNQLLSVGFYPDTDAVSWNQRGGAIGSGFNIQLTAPQGIIYYTTDGSDPRLVGGALSGSASTYNGAFQIAEHATVRARAFHNGEWSAIDTADFVIADAPADSTNLRVAEVHYNPAGPSASELAAGHTDGDDFEFIELINTSNQTISLDGVELKRSVVGSALDGITFEFGLLSLDPGERIVVVSDLAAFQERYGSSINVAGEYTGKLANSGETLHLTDATGNTIQQFAYDDDAGASWPITPDGDGPSLVIIDTEGDYDAGNNWTASSIPNGTPGSAEPGGLVGDLTGDGIVGLDDLRELLIYWGDSASSSAGALAADLDNDGTVNTPDLDIVRNNFGQTAPASANDPQPTSNSDRVVDENTDEGETTTPTTSGDPTETDAGMDSNTNDSGNTPEGDATAEDNPARNPEPTHPNKPASPILTPAPATRPKVEPVAPTPRPKPATPSPAADPIARSKPASPTLTLTPDTQRAAATRPAANALSLTRPGKPAMHMDNTPAREVASRRFNALAMRTHK